MTSTKNDDIFSLDAYSVILLGLDDAFDVLDHLRRGGNMKKANEKIRERIEANRFLYWEVAEKVGIAQSNLSVWLRTEMREDRKQRVEKAIDELLAERKEG